MELSTSIEYKRSKSQQWALKHLDSICDSFWAKSQKVSLSCSCKLSLPKKKKSILNCWVDAGGVHIYKINLFFVKIMIHAN